MAKDKRKEYNDKKWVEDQKTIKQLKKNIKELLDQNKELRRELDSINKTRTPKDTAENKLNKKPRIEKPKEIKKTAEETLEDTRNKWKKWREDQYGKYREES